MASSEVSLPDNTLLTVADQVLIDPVRGRKILTRVRAPAAPGKYPAIIFSHGFGPRLVHPHGAALAAAGTHLEEFALVARQPKRLRHVHTIGLDRLRRTWTLMSRSMLVTQVCVVL